MVEAKTLNSNLTLESILEAKSILFENIKTFQSQFYTVGISFVSSKSATKHALNFILVYVLSCKSQ
jgi:hypothetical protein